MSADTSSKLPDIVRRHEAEILTDWMRQQQEGTGRRRELISDRDLETQSREFLGLVRDAVKDGLSADVLRAPGVDRVREMLGGISRSRGLQGFSPSETASSSSRSSRPSSPASAAKWLGRRGSPRIRRTDDLLDRLGLYTTELHQKGREEVILRQQQDVLELSTPVVKLWDGSWPFR